jgi:hypothetical protein
MHADTQRHANLRIHTHTYTHTLTGKEMQSGTLYREAVKRVEEEVEKEKEEEEE